MLSATQPVSENLPAHGCRHVAIIMDGNGRWAKKQGKIRAFGHKAGAKSVRRAVSFAANNGIDALTLYAFSSENWNRPAQEVSALMELFVWALDSEVKSLPAITFACVLSAISADSTHVYKNVFANQKRLPPIIRV